MHFPRQQGHFDWWNSRHYGTHFSYLKFFKAHEKQPVLLKPFWGPPSWLQSEVNSLMYSASFLRCTLKPRKNTPQYRLSMCFSVLIVWQNQTKFPLEKGHTSLSSEGHYCLNHNFQTSAITAEKQLKKTMSTQKTYPPLLFFSGMNNFALIWKDGIGKKRKNEKFSDQKASMTNLCQLHNTSQAQSENRISKFQVP